MRTIIVASVVVAFVSLATDRGRAQAALEGRIFFAPNSARSVTLSRNGDLLASFNIPKGNFLSVSYDDKQPHSITAGRWEFHGNIAVRTQPASAAPRLQPGKTLDQVMEEAPLLLTGQGTDVVIENVP